MTRVRVVALAEAEFREAATWYAERDPRVAERFTDEVRRTLELIATFPQIGSRVPGIDDPDVRRLPIQKFPYHAVFARLPDGIEVVAIAHDRRRPAYFLSRLHHR